MASLVLGVAGAVIGAPFGPLGASIGFALGSAAGGLLFPPKGPDGPRLNDLSVQSSTYGKGIPIPYGKVRIAGNVIWADKIREHSHDEGGKGGPEFTTYSYTCSFAVSICEGPIQGITRIWADGLLIYDARPTNTGEKEAFKSSSYQIYLGTEEQMPDPEIQALIGDTPAYRGQAYFRVSDLELGKFGNRIPSLSFETGVPSEVKVPGVVMFPTDVKTAGDTIVYNPAAKTVWSLAQGQYKDAALTGFVVYDPETGEEIGAINAPVAQLEAGIFGEPTYSPVTRAIYVQGMAGDFTDYRILKFDAETGDYIRSYGGPGGGYFAISPANGNVWIASGSGGAGNFTTITEYDDATGSPGWSAFRVNPDDGGPGAMVVDKHNVAWMLFGSAVLVTNRATGALDYAYGDAHGSTIYGIAYDPDRDSIWLATNPYNITNAVTADIVSISQGAVTTITYSTPFWYDTNGLVVETGRMIHFIAGGGLPSLRNSSAMATKISDNTFTVPIDTSADAAEDFDSSQNFFESNRGTLVEISATGGNVVQVIEAQNSGLGNGMNLFYDPNNKVIWAPANAWGALVGFNAADGSVFAVVDAPAKGIDTVPDGFPIWWVTPGDGDLWINDATFERIYRVRFGVPAAQEGPLSLAQIVSDISLRSGLGSDDIDVEELVDLVDGYTIGHQMAARSALEPLMQAYFFDPVESDYKIKFRKRGRPVVFDIPDDDLAAHSSGSEPPELIEIIRKQELDLPQSVSVKYVNPDADYQTSTQYEARMTGRSQSAVTVELPIVMPDEKAKQVAAAALYTAWAERTGLKFSTSLAYAKYEPTDVGTVHGRIVRIANRKRNGGLIEWEVFADGNTIYPSESVTQGGAAAPASPPDQTIPTIPAIQLVALDAPIAVEGTTSPVITFAVQGTSAGFTGAQIWKSVDGGVSYQPIATAPNASLVGTASNALGDYHGGDTFDELNTVTVSLLPSSSGATLSSATEEQVLNGANAAMLGNEVFQYKRAVLNDDGTYTLSGLLRYRRGTDYATHAAGEHFVPLTTNLVQIPVSTAEIGLPRQYKAVPNGGTLASAQAVTLTYTGNDLKPYSPAHIGGWRDADGNLTLTWVRRTRVGGEWRDFVEVPLAEASEAYDVEIIGSAGAVVRTFSGVTAPTLVYTAEQQTADFGSPQSTVNARVYQMSSVIGRGFPGTGAV